MSTKLEKYIQMNKEELSSFTPSASLWLSIGAGLTAKTTFITSKIAWLKYFGYSATAVAVATGITFLVSQKGTEQISEQTMAPENSIAGSIADKVPASDDNKMIALMETMPCDSPKTKSEKISGLPPVPAAAPSPALAPLAPLAPIAPTAPVAPVAPIPATPIQGFIAPPSLKAGTPIALKVTSKGELNADTLFEGVKKIELYVASSDVFINRSVLRTTRFGANISTESKGLVTGGKNTYELHYQLKDSVLSITLENNCKKRVVIGSYVENAMITLDVPDHVALDIKNSYGMVTAKGLVGTEYKFESSSGDIMTEDIKGDLKIKSGYGMVKASNINGNFYANVASGDIYLDKLSGNAEVNSSYGQQVYKDITGSVKIRSASGDVQITGMTGDTDIKSNYGNIRLTAFEGIPNLEAVSGDIMGKNIRLKGNMSVKSNYGNIRMNLLNDVNELSFDLSTNYGTINVNKGGTNAEDDSSVKIKQGAILITGVTTSGNQSYK